MKLLYYIFFTILVFPSCAQKNKVTKQQVDNTMKKNTSEFVKNLSTKKYGEYFFYPDHQETLEFIWSIESDQVVFQDICTNAEIDLLARIVAAEVLLQADLLLFYEVDRRKLAKIYVEAFENDISKMADSWGIPFEQSRYGILGDHLISIGEMAIPFLKPLLSNESLRNNYIESEVGALAEGYKLRVKDFAAFYISRIQGQTYDFLADPKARDRQIKILLNELHKSEEE